MNNNKSIQYADLQTRQLELNFNPNRTSSIECLIQTSPSTNGFVKQNSVGVRCTRNIKIQ